MNIDLLTSEELEKLRELILAADNIVVCSHVSPDGDALGSSLGWAEALRLFGKKSTIIVPDQFPDFLRWLPGIETIVRYDKRSDEADAYIADADLIFCLDFNELSRTDNMQASLGAARGKKVLILHHLPTAYQRNRQRQDIPQRGPYLQRKPPPSSGLRPV